MSNDNSTPNQSGSGLVAEITAIVQVGQGSDIEIAHRVFTLLVPAFVKNPALWTALIDEGRP